MNSRMIGGLMLIIGTSIGGGMLALPVSTASAGFKPTLIFLVLCWLVMTSGALLMLEVNARLPRGSNIISMAKATLGLPGQILAWIAYLMLLYSLLSAYISGGSDIFGSLLQKIHLQLPTTITAIIFTTIFGLIVFSGIKAVDYVNRALMVGKLGIYLLLVLTIAPHINPSLLQGGSAYKIHNSLMVLISSFGFASIVPSLRDYFEDDIQSLRRVIIFGSLIPLVCYALWNAVIMGVIGREGEAGLLALNHTSHATSGLVSALKVAIQAPIVTGFFSFFTAICMLTAFLGVSLGLFDFLADGLNLKKEGAQSWTILALTFLPPLAVVLFNPGIYIRAIAYAGLCCVILLLLLPSLMAWQGRKKLATTDINLELLPGGKIALSAITVISFILLLQAYFHP